MNATEEISGWLNKQHHWLLEAAHRILAQGGLANEDIADLVELVKKPEATNRDARTFPGVSSDLASKTDLRLGSIGPVAGIDALNPRKPLSFGNGNLSVVYGVNGSGKSGYVRIITKACGKAHSVDLKPNVYEVQQTEQKCTFTYTIAGNNKDCVWMANDSPVEDLKSVDVFDTECGRIYLEKDMQQSYEPPELSLFVDIVEACKRVDEALSAEKGKLVCKLPGIPSQYATTVAGREYAAISKNVPPAKLEELVTWTTEDEKMLTEQRARLNLSNPAKAAEGKRAIRKQIVAIRDLLQKAINALGAEELEELRRLTATATGKRQAATEGAKAMRSIAKIDGIGSETWKAMWEAARAYSTSKAYPDSAFPSTENGARCVLCHQNLDDEAKRRLEGFEAFVKGALETDATNAERSLNERLKLLPVRPTPGVLATECLAAGLNDDVQTVLESTWGTLESFLAPLREGKVHAARPELDGTVAGLLTTLGTLASAAAKAAKDLEADAMSPDRNEARAKVVELEGKKWVTDQAAAVRAEVERLKKLAEYEEWQRKTKTAGISRKAGELSEVLITEAYLRRFNAELKMLGANKIQVELVKTAITYGKTKHGIRLRNATDGTARVAEILSEGERRIVSLAAFLADVTGRNSNAPFVFDDPISSLDQFFEEKVIGRLVELSKYRQVIVFTHRLSFLGVMNDLADDGLHDVHIRREPWGTGQPGEVPLFGKKPDKALNNLKGDRLAKARKALNNEGYDAYYPLAKSICTDFRILMERIVEIVFLADVVQRHRRAINTMGKIQKLAKIQKGDCDLIDGMMTRYSCYEHSQPDEAPVDVPEPEVIANDIDRMIEWHQDFMNK